MDVKDKIISLSTIFDGMEQLKLTGITKGEYKQLTVKISLMLVAAYDKGFEDGKK